VKEKKMESLLDDDRLKFLDFDGLGIFAGKFFEKIQKSSQLNISFDLDENSTNQQIPSAKAVYDLMIEVLGSITRLTKKVVSALPDEGEEQIIYLVATAPDSGEFSQHVYIDGEWYSLGNTKIDLSNYWAKDDLVAMTPAEIQKVIDDIMGA
jgi:hypothetical protein